MERSLSFRGQNIAVTGGCSGIGFAVVQTLLALNASVYVADITEHFPAGFHDLASHADIKSRLHFTGKCDVTDRNECKAFIDSIPGRLDGLVNSAGLCKFERDLGSDEIYKLHMDVNVTGTWNMSTEAIKRMSGQEDVESPGAVGGAVRSVGQGSIVNIGSGASLRGLPGLAAYTASKHAVLGLTRSWAKTFPKLRINAIAPGMTDTPMALASVPGDGNELLKGHSVINGVDSIPKGRMAYSTDIADCVVFLLSDWSSFMTGQCLPVNGGNL